MNSFTPLVKLSLVTLIAFSFTACKTTEGDIGSLSLFSSAPDIEKRSFDLYTEALDPALRQETDSGQKVALLSQGVGLDAAYSERLGVLDLPKTENRLNALLAKIQAAVPARPVAARVYIEPFENYMARAEKEGAIMVSLGLLDQVSSDEELIFVLAHEYAHILLGHFEDGETQQALAKASNFAGEMLVLRAQLSGDADVGELNNALIYPRGISMVTETIFLRGWNRSQEFAADLFATDVLAAMGRDPLAGNDAISRIEDTTETIESLPIFQKNSLDMGFSALMQGNSFAKGQLKERVISSAFTMGGALLGEISGQTHPSAEDRQQAISDYVDHHGLAPAGFIPPATETIDQLKRDPQLKRWLKGSEQIIMAGDAISISGDSNIPDYDKAVSYMRQATQNLGADNYYLRMNFSEVRASQGEYDKALQNLDLINSKARLPYRVGRLRIQRQLDNNRFGDAIKSLKAIEEQYPDQKNDLLPLVKTPGIPM